MDGFNRNDNALKTSTLCSKSTDNRRVVHISSNNIFVYLTWNIRRATNGPISTHVLPSREIVFLGIEGSILEYIGNITVLSLKQCVIPIRKNR